jgi:hypothetical protein
MATKTTSSEMNDEMKLMSLVLPEKGKQRGIDSDGAQVRDFPSAIVSRLKMRSGRGRQMDKRSIIR